MNANSWASNSSSSLRINADAKMHAVSAPETICIARIEGAIYHRRGHFHSKKMPPILQQRSPLPFKLLRLDLFSGPLSRHCGADLDEPQRRTAEGFMLGEQLSHPAAASLVEVPLYPGAGIEIVQHYRRSAMSICEAGMPRRSLDQLLTRQFGLLSRDGPRILSPKQGQGFLGVFFGKALNLLHQDFLCRGHRCLLPAHGEPPPGRAHLQFATPAWIGSKANSSL